MWLVFSLLGAYIFAQRIDSFQKRKLIFEDNFSKENLNSNWIVEANEKTAGYSIENGQLQLNTEGGITLWYNKFIRVQFCHGCSRLFDTHKLERSAVVCSIIAPNAIVTRNTPPSPGNEIGNADYWCLTNL